MEVQLTTDFLNLALIATGYSAIHFYPTQKKYQEILLNLSPLSSFLQQFFSKDYLIFPGC